MAYLTIRIKGTDGHTKLTLDKPRCVIGRSSSCEVPIKHTSISREHLVLVQDGDSWFAEDLGSANGSWLNKEKLTARTTLKERDILKCGQARITFHAGVLGADAAPIELSLKDDDDDAAAPAAGPSGTRGVDDPPEAMACQHCNGWFSIAHRTSGDTMECPRCGASNTVPVLSA